MITHSLKTICLVLALLGLGTVLVFNSSSFEGLEVVSMELENQHSEAESESDSSETETELFTEKTNEQMFIHFNTSLPREDIAHLKPSYYFKLEIPPLV